MNFTNGNKALELGYWSFPGAWNLGFGASAVIAVPD
jgi:RimJ/RimL family protein N-acetyltransferase